MILEHLVVAGLRNIDRIELSADRKINWITGGNGAGKTSLLEAIFLLSRGRSFRGRKHGSVLGVGKQRVQITGAVAPDNDNEPSGSIQFVQHGKDVRLFENEQPVDSVHRLRNRLHVRMIGDNAQGLLEGQPHTRRLFLDWNLFHVEHGYGRILTDFRRIANQRNAWLRSSMRGPAVWDQPYCDLATSITAARQAFVEQLQIISDQITADPGTASPLQVAFSRGWPQERELRDLLTDGLQHDRARGYTFFGPSRADFSVRYAEHPPLPSRGQTKLLVIALQLAAHHYWVRSGGPLPIWLLDDLSAELDTERFRSAVRHIAATGAQLFLTSVATPDELRRVCQQGTMFHVEHGMLSK